MWNELKVTSSILTENNTFEKRLEKALKKEGKILNIRDSFLFNLLMNYYYFLAICSPMHLCI